MGCYFIDRELVQLRREKVMVCWDMVGCPIPRGMDVVTVSNNIRLGVKMAGYQGDIEINAFGDSLQSLGDFSKTKVTMNVLTEGDKEERLQMILSHFLCKAVEYCERINLMLIAGDITTDSQFNFECAFDLLEMKRYNCMLAQPNYLPQLIADSITTAWVWSTLSTGGKPLRRGLKFAAADDDDHHTSAATSSDVPRSMTYKFPDYYYNFNTADTICFWDLSGCPIPKGLNVCDAVSNIQYLVRATGFGSLRLSSLLAYCDIPSMYDVFGDTSIPFPLRHVGTKDDRRKKIFADFMCKALIGHRQPVNLVLILEDISGQPEILHALEFCKRRKNIHILLSQPHLDKVSKKLLSSVGSLWLWKSLALATEGPLTEEDIEEKGEGDIEGKREGDSKGEGDRKGEGRRRRKRGQRKRQRKRRRIRGA